MNKSRRLFAVLRPRRVVAAGLFLLCTYLFASNLDPTPTFTVPTETKDGQGKNLNPFDFPIVMTLCNDSRQVTLVYHSGFSKGGITRVELWDLATGTNRTPRYWDTPEWRTLLNGGWIVRDAELLDVASDPSGQEFLRDEAAWMALGQRLGLDWAPQTEDGRHTRMDLCFSLDGQHIAYVIPSGWPATEPWPNELSKATVIEESRTGRRIATLLTVTNRVTIAPGGRTAVWRITPGDDESQMFKVFRRTFDNQETCEKEATLEEARYVLWDLETSTARARLWLPKDGFGHVEYTPDGRYVFARCQSLLRWWDAATGKQAGEMIAPPNRKFMDGGRVLVIQSINHDMLYFWDVPTGRPLPDWEVPQPREGTGTLGRIESTGGHRYVALPVEPDRQAPANSFPGMDRLVTFLSDKLGWSDRSRILVLDVIERRELGTVPGSSAAFSDNGQWLATINSEGVIRVWKMPFGRPWGRSAVYSTALVGGCWVVFILLGRLRQRLRKRQQA